MSVSKSPTLEYVLMHANRMGIADGADVLMGPPRMERRSALACCNYRVLVSERGREDLRGVELDRASTRHHWANEDRRDLEQVMLGSSPRWRRQGGWCLERSEEPVTLRDNDFSTFPTCDLKNCNPKVLEEEIMDGF